MRILIAFASIDGTYIDQHFGSARIFQIYEITPDSYKQVESRRTQAFCQGSCEGGFEHLLSALNDCDAIFVNRIGQSAAAFMIGHGKRVFEASGPVDAVIEQLINENILELR